MEFHGLGEKRGLGRGVDEWDHEARGAVFEQVVEIGGVAAAGADDAVDVSEVVHRDHALELVAFPSAVFAVEPDGVKTGFGGVSGHHRGRVIHARDASG